MLIIFSPFPCSLTETIVIDSSSDEEESCKQRRCYTRQQLIEIAENLKDTFPPHLQAFYKRDADAYFVINREVRLFCF